MPEGVDETAYARETLCRLLAACYYEPGPEFAEEGVFDAMRAAAARIDPELAARAQRLGDDFAAEDPECLLIDYTRLFLGPVGALAKPYGSVWLESGGPLMRDSTLEVMRLYNEGGFEIAEDFRELPDHVAAELEFFYLLIYRENAARRTGDAAAIQSIVAVRRRLLDEHLGKWVSPFAAAVRSGAQCAYYRELAGLTERFVQIEAAMPGE